MLNTAKQAKQDIDEGISNKEMRNKERTHLSNVESGNEGNEASSNARLADFQRRVS